MESNFIQIIIQGGSVGIAALLIWVLYKVFGLMVAAMDRNTEAWGNTQIAITRLTERLDLLK